MKASSLTSGKTVICPQCLKKIVVPHKSDRKAEQLYLNMKQNGGSVVAKTSQPQKKQSPANFVTLEKDEVDKWIDDFWTSLPEDDTRGESEILPETTNKNSTVTNKNIQYKNIQYKNNTQQNQTTTDEQHTILHNNKNYLLTILLVFCISFAAGFVTSSFLIGGKTSLLADSDNKNNTVDKSVIRVEGKLSYKNEFGVKKPDADATILFIPAEARTAIPISSDGFRAANGTLDPNNDNVQRITELGGIVQRTGAGGEFKFSLKSEGNYVAIMISSHVKRTNVTQLPPEIINYLKKFFRNPAGLIDDFRVEKDEYNIKGGTQIIHKTFE
jgi:hypothetical protein